MSRIHSECTASDRSDQSVASGVSLRQEPDEEEDEEEDEGDGREKKDDDDDDEGYSEAFLQADCITANFLPR